MKQLSAETVRLLSSSQVITSIWNVVKELIENSLDAGATSLEVKLENYGLDRIEVRDNGSGIKAADTSVMAVKHYTSKISCHDDLEHLETYGFRGEALGSICAVSEVVVTTKTAVDPVSTQYTLDINGQVVSQKPSHLGQGTTVCAQKLFKNLPVRRQYYSNTKKCKEELKKVQELLMAFAIIRPELRITLTHNKSVIWQKSRVSDHRAALMAVLGAATVANMLPLQRCQEQPEISIDGFFPKPDSDYQSMSCSTPDKTFIFVNNRPVHHKDILKLVRQCYANVSQCNSDATTRRFPILMMNVTIPASSVDVNLTPDKTQVMLQNKEVVLSVVENMLVSLYGSEATSNVTPADVHTLFEADQDQRRTADDNRAETVLNEIHKEPLLVAPQPIQDHRDGTPLGTLEQSTTDTEQRSNTSLSQTTLTSSSSSSEDWIINKFPGEFDSVNFSLFAENIALNSTVDSEHCASKDSEGRVDPGPSSEVSAESWSTGRAFTDPSTSTYLEPVKLPLPATNVDCHGAEVIDKSSSPSKRPLNVIVEKTAKVTAYDLINNRCVRQPLSAYSLFEQDTRSTILQDSPRTSLQDVTMAVKERWESLGEEDRKKYEERAEKALNTYNRQRTRALEGEAKRLTKADWHVNGTLGLKRKAPLSNQQILDQLFSSQPARKRSTGKPSKPLPFDVAALKQRLNLLSQRRGPSPQGLTLVNHSASHSAWIVLCGPKLMLLNPFRLEEALLFKRLRENNILPAASLQTPIRLTDGDLGGPEYMDALLKMDKARPAPSGETHFTDARLVANGFQIRLIPGSSSTERHLEVTAMTDCMPFFGIADLREILAAVKNSNAKTVEQCRPLKVTHYLKGEAVRLARQLPLSPSREDVINTLSRMNQQLEDGTQTCLHGRPFFHQLMNVPETEQEALKIMSGDAEKEK